MKMRFGFKLWSVIIIFVLISFLLNAGSAASLYYAGWYLISDTYKSLLFASSYLLTTFLYHFIGVAKDYVFQKYIIQKVLQDLKLVLNKFNNMSIWYATWNIENGKYLNSLKENFSSPLSTVVSLIYVFLDTFLSIILNLGFFFFFNWILGLITLIFSLLFFLPQFSYYSVAEKYTKKFIQQSNRWFQKMAQLFGLFNFYSVNNITNQIVDQTQAKLSEVNFLGKKIEILQILHNFVSGLIIVLCEIAFYLVSGFSVIDVDNGPNRIVALGFFSITNVPQILMKTPLLSNTFISLLINKKIYTKFWEFNKGDQYSENQLTKYEKPFQLIHIKDLTFNYPNKPTLFNKLNLTIEKNKKYLLLGANGKGKSTLTKLLTGIEREYYGQMLFNNDTEIKNLQQKVLGNYFNLVSNKNILLDDTLRNNVALYKEHVSDDQIKASLKVMNLSELNQLDHVYQQGKNGLSVGQVQRLDIARCVLNPKPILVLDEALSNVDVFNQEKILNYFLSQKDLTFILITHHLKPDWQAKFDQVIQL